MVVKASDPQAVSSQANQTFAISEGISNAMPLSVDKFMHSCLMRATVSIDYLASASNDSLV